MKPQTFLAAGLAVGLLAGCSNDEPASDDTAPAEQPSSGTAPVSDSPSPEDGDAAAGTQGQGQSLGEVGDAVTALQTAGDEVSGQPFDMETETRDGQQVWEITVAVDGQEHELWVSQDGSEVIDRREHNTPDDDVQKVGSVQISAEQALRTAAEQQEGRLDEMELDSHGGTIVWQVELRQSDGSTTELEVDASSGAVRIEDQD